jgi:DDE superfamily endonuclease/Helix-turn-helix of DDE superfamily endonuclease
MKKLLDYIFHKPHLVLVMLGINLEAFQCLTAQVEKAQSIQQSEQEAEKIRINAKGAGRPPKLNLKESIALCLFYLRQNPTFEVLGLIFDVSRSEAHSTFHWGLNWIRQVLPASLYEEFGDDPELWSLIQEILLDEVLLTDSTEQSCERPQDKEAQKSWYSGKKKQHTQKTQILGTSDGLEIVDVIAGVKGPTADINLFREQQPLLDPEQQFMGDKAYVGGKGMTTPHKKPKKKELTEEQRAENKVISGKRIFIEHLMCRLKVFRILSDQFRLKSRRYRSVMLAICGLFRLKLGRIDFTIYGC